MRIALIDYDAGNTASLGNALTRLGFEYVITRDPEIIRFADRIIFPGQGRAGSAMMCLRESGLDRVLSLVTKPFLGVCLGMQLMFDSTEEDGAKGLSIVPGAVRKFREPGLNVPQIGWNTVTAMQGDPLFYGVPDTFLAYFANSYYAPSGAAGAIGTSTYGQTVFSSVIRKGNFCGIQFHPEKSGAAGLRLLKNFCEPTDAKRNEALVIPAIDIMDGKCVRLTRGDFGTPTTYADDPVATAHAFVADGARYLHVIDLDGARTGKPANAELIVRLAREARVPLQVGGGIRTAEDARRYLDFGVDRVIIGTAALESPDVVKKLVAEYGPGRIAVAVDEKNGRVARRGWQSISNETPDGLLRKLSTLGITTVLYTATARDGSLEGPDYENVRRVLGGSFRVMVAGGVSTAEDALRLASMGAYGIVIGKALYERATDIQSVLVALPSQDVLRACAPRSAPTKRVIACMDVADGRVVKGTRFTDLKEAGDPVELARRYSDEDADELVLLDINATVENRPTLYALVRRVADTISIPFTVGGGVKNVDEVRKLLAAGADKVSVGSAAVETPDFVEQAVREFGSQCIVVSIDPKKRPDGSWEVYAKGGREATGVDAVWFAKDMARRGAGELLVNSLDKDGTRAGYDLSLLRAITDAVSIPVIASSGAGSRKDFRDALTEGGADAVLAAGLFHSGDLTIPDVKAYLAADGMSIRV